ncbi:hypothetical protein GCM10007906_41230 [Vibrio hyugaensis]|uniref:Uncharacterized protein n=1 Tax=Vibrio hyugaensis TaxID=1534743 RepID=A0ABQ5Y6Q2_9VIBR|nr:hypothetical protein GCM10007906_41230 [Vibrio hyugaensis]
MYIDVNDIDIKIALCNTLDLSNLPRSIATLIIITTAANHISASIIDSNG